MNQSNKIRRSVIFRNLYN